MVDIKKLGALAFFEGFGDGELAELAKITKEVSFKRGETLFKESDPGGKLHVIVDGEVKSCVAAPDGELFTLSIQKRGDSFGAMSFVDGTSRTSTMVTVTDGAALYMEKADFEKIMEEHPELTRKFLVKIITGTHAIVRAMNAKYVQMITYMWGRKRAT